MVGTLGIEPCPNFYAWPPSSFHLRRRLNAAKLWDNIDAVIGDNNQIAEDVFDFMISYLPFPQKSIRSELTKLFSQYINQSAPNLVKMYMTIWSRMSSIMELIRPELSKLSALESEKLPYLTLFTL